MIATETKKKQRSCIGCGKQDAKGVLLRVVRAADGSVSFDATGRAPGRGAYVCSADCFALARKTKKLERALRVKVDSADYERIAKELDACVAKAEKIEE